jgi:hypothetical protein
MTDRDRKMLVAIIGVVVVAGIWLLVIGPRKNALEVAEADKVVAAKELQDAKSAATTGQEEKKTFNVSYAQLVRLGKAIPSRTDEFSLVVEMYDIAKQSGVTMQKVSVQEGGGANDGAAPGAPGASGEKTTCDSSAATGATGAPAAPATPAPTPQTGVGKTIDQAKDGAAAGDADAERAEGSSAEPQADCASSPSAADLDAAEAGLKLDNFELTFRGSYFELHRFFRRLHNLVQRRNIKSIRVHGRLLMVKRIDLAVDGFPVLEAKVGMTGYRLPPGVSATAGATPGGPAATPAQPAAGQPATEAPPAATTGVR